MFSNQIISLFFGSQFIEATLSLKILVLAMLVHNLAYWVNPSILSSGNAKFLTITTLLTTCVYCISLPYLINLMGHDGAAISLLIKNISTLILGVVFYYKFLKNKN
jgi:O-antigen/teichoic acid export membrane protein